MGQGEGALPVSTRHPLNLYTSPDGLTKRFIVTQSFKRFPSSLRLCILYHNEKGLKQRDTVIWNQCCITSSNGRYFYFTMMEYSLNSKGSNVILYHKLRFYSSDK